ncbi:replication protein A 14 kDa subunit [Corythoichthys intestinalis]|uniref:replication protein A 14 kDa subunit n=1 Tax=Corythoichthys intestinalis TaxID=161448 RepID=UPI0025A55A01|nr:replication protein A 14 kDa subunit [Corythoichthys intestinalis]XP_061808936.1 replication protein A 14 kDa subunit [Nerophis lumbriciformis]
MSTILDLPKPRINFSMLGRYINKPVCFVGRVEKVHPTGKSFTVVDGEGQCVSVELNDPLGEELSGIVEVIGMVSNKGALMATTFSMLRDEKGIPFDLELYNEAIKLIHDFPQHYPFEVASSG